MLCECCEGAVPDDMIVTDEYTSNSTTPKKHTRKICVLCKKWLLIGFNDCYASVEWHDWRNKKAKVIRRMWFDLAELNRETPNFLPQLRCVEGVKYDLGDTPEGK